MKLNRELSSGRDAVRIPDMRTRDYAPLTLTENNAPDGGELLPGFALSLNDLFVVFDSDE